MSITITSMSGTRTRRNNPAFGNWLRQEIKSRKWTQSELARRIGVRQGTVSRWVLGRPPEAEYIDLIADALFLDYDLVATKAGYRPNTDMDPVDKEKVRLRSMFERLRFDDLGRAETLENLFNSWLEQDRREDEKILKKVTEEG